MVWRRRERAPEGEGEALVALSVGGGVTGTRDQLRVLTSGRAVLTRDVPGHRRPLLRSLQLAPMELDEIERLVGTADLEAAAARAERMKPPWLSAADAQSVSITVGDRTVASHDAPVVLPAAGPTGEPPPAPRTDGEPDPLRSLRVALLEVRRRLSS